MQSKKPSNSEYLKYSGMALQMFLIIFAGWFVGDQLDKYLEMKQPVFAIIFLVVFITGYFYKLIRDLS